MKERKKELEKEGDVYTCEYFMHGPLLEGWDAVPSMYNNRGFRGEICLSFGAWDRDLLTSVAFRVSHSTVEISRRYQR